MRVWIFVVLPFLAVGAQAAESLDYVTEHLFEASMNARYHSLPEIETDPASRAVRIKLGVARIHGGPYASSTLQSAVQKSQPLGKDWSLIYAGFFDYTIIDTAATIVDATIIKNQPLPETRSARIRLTPRRSHTRHLGASVGLVRRFSSAALQLGLMAEALRVDDHQLAFSTADQPGNYDGVIDYRNTYLAYTPYATLRWFHSRPWLGLNVSGRVLLAFPLPRKDLARVVTVGATRLDLETQEQHIPDGFIGIGYSLESARRKWRIDLGATIYMGLMEEKMHNGIRSPLLLNFSFVF